VSGRFEFIIIKSETQARLFESGKNSAFIKKAHPGVGIDGLDHDRSLEDGCDCGHVIPELQLDQNQGFRLDCV